MDKFIIITAFLLVITSFNGCGEKKDKPMVDMDTIRSDGSHDDKYIFRKELEKEEKRGKKYKKDEF